MSLLCCVRVTTTPCLKPHSTKPMGQGKRAMLPYEQNSRPLRTAARFAGTGTPGRNFAAKPDLWIKKQICNVYFIT